MSKSDLILIVDDDANIREVVRFALDKDGFATMEAANGELALALALGPKPPTLVILDIMMPEKDGIAVCRELRKTSDIPVIFLSSKDDELDRIIGLELGGDDYLTKPFSPRELVARVRAVIRRLTAAKSGASADIGGTAESELRCGAVRLNPTTCKAYLGEAEVVLTAMEFGLLRALLSHPKKVFSRDELMSKAYDHNTVVSDRTIDSHIRRIRRKFSSLGCDPVETVTGFGYKMSDRP